LWGREKDVSPQLQQRNNHPTYFCCFQTVHPIISGVILNSTHLCPGQMESCRSPWHWAFLPSQCHAWAQCLFCQFIPKHACHSPIYCQRPAFCVLIHYWCLCWTCPSSCQCESRCLPPASMMLFLILPKI
jgi:hypothetical protein